MKGKEEDREYFGNLNFYFKQYYVYTCMCVYVCVLWLPMLELIHASGTLC